MLLLYMFIVECKDAFRLAYAHLTRSAPDLLQVTIHLPVGLLLSTPLQFPAPSRCNMLTAPACRLEARALRQHWSSRCR